MQTSGAHRLPRGFALRGPNSCAPRCRARVHFGPCRRSAAVSGSPIPQLDANGGVPLTEAGSSNLARRGTERSCLGFGPAVTTTIGGSRTPRAQVATSGCRSRARNKTRFRSVTSISLTSPRVRAARQAGPGRGSVGRRRGSCSWPQAGRSPAAGGGYHPAVRRPRVFDLPAR